MRLVYQEITSMDHKCLPRAKSSDPL